MISIQSLLWFLFQCVLSKSLFGDCDPQTIEKLPCCLGIGILLFHRFGGCCKYGKRGSKPDSKPSLTCHKWLGLCHGFHPLPWLPICNGIGWIPQNHLTISFLPILLLLYASIPMFTSQIPMVKSPFLSRYEIMWILITGDNTMISISSD